MVSRRSIVKELEQATRNSVRPAAAFSEEGAVLYRGGTLESINNDEFRDNTINGNFHDIWWTNMTVSERDATKEGSSLSKYPTRAPEKVLADHIEEHDEVPITGGLTDRIATAMNFSRRGPTGLGVVLYLDAVKIPGNLLAIKYTPEWVDNHPGVVSHVDDLAVGEVFVNQKLWGIVQGSMGEGDATIQEWGEQARDKITWNRFSKENEVIAQTAEIDLDGAMMAFAAHFHTTAAVGGELEASLAELPGYTQRLAREGEQNVTKMSDREQAAAMYDEMVPMLQHDPENFYVVVREDERLDREERQIPADSFKFAYDGDRFYEKFSEVGLLVGKNRALP